ncbi:aldose 1-epimerase family protein [uncultured Flavobacterium sp.]|uniref:aldose 1-epimerase family protein n=1 Tax=uncultured Flavobacterium sp. TaxID=165435 RepID=UPI0025E142F4|nr:aldose 1-epimerase family protein [uncultured Flavobacterium sp.]
MNITISNNMLTARINSKGAELNSLKKENREYIWEGNPAFWGKHSPILFPIVGTLKDNSYTYNNQKFELSRHGFARDHEFKVIESSEDKVVFSLSSSEETLKVYPFKFELQVIYTLGKNQLHIQYKLINNDSSKLPFSIGGHPAFALPGKFEDYSLLFEKQEILKSYELENDLVSDKTRTFELGERQFLLNYATFENDALIFKSMESKSIEILENQKPLLRFSFKDFPNFGIWTKINAPFICLEPWLGYSDTFSSNGNLFEKEGIIILEENKTFEAGFTIEIL